MEYAGEAIRGLSMEGRMTVCNMSIEGGARAGLIAPDETTFAYIKGRPKAPKGDRLGHGARYWETLHSDEGAVFDREVRLDAATAAAAGHLGHEPGERHQHQRRGARPGEDRRSRQAPRRRARARLHGPRAEHADQGHHDRARVPRLLHQRPHRGPARRGEDRRRASASTRASTPWSCRAPGW